MSQKPALLMLDDGACFEGLACGACREAAGEVVFTTGLCGYQETLTDPSFYGQIVTFTAAHMGNYGTNPYDDEAPAVYASGAVFHDLFTAAEDIPFPHWRATGSLDKKLRENGVTAIHGVDTRALTLHLREHGARSGLISALDLDKASLLRRVREVPSIQGLDLAQKATRGEQYRFDPPAGINWPVLVEPLAQPDRRLKVAVLDFGVKRSILMHLYANGMEPLVFPARATAEDVLAVKPDGVMLSNGPGDPGPCDYAIRTIRDLLGRLPMFGICLGHQLMGLAHGGKTFKMPFGHHGMNHPVRDVKTGRVSITSQNHGFNVDPESLPQDVRPTHWNLNDGTLEGMESTSVPAFSVQYHPETAPGTWDAHDLFPRFRRLILGVK